MRAQGCCSGQSRELLRDGVDRAAVITRIAPFHEAADAMTDPAIKIVFVRE